MSNDPLHKLANEVHELMLRILALELKEAKHLEAIEKLALKIISLELRGKETNDA